jgi:hypothetical protein
VEELDAGFFFDAKGLAADVTDDFPTAADDEVAGALGGACEGAENGEMMAAQGGAGDRA